MVEVSVNGFVGVVKSDYEKVQEQIRRDRFLSDLRPNWGSIPLQIMYQNPYLLSCKYADFYCNISYFFDNEVKLVFFHKETPVGYKPFIYRTFIKILTGTESFGYIGIYSWQQAIWQAEWHYEKWLDLGERFEL